MTAIRILVVGTVAVALAFGIIVDRGERPAPDPIASDSVSVPFSGAGGVWFCPGGSAPGGLAEVGIEMVNAGAEPAEAIITGVRSGSGDEPRTLEEVVAPGERRFVPLADVVTDSAWMGAMVEVDSAEVVVEQTYVGAASDGEASSGSDRAPCHTTTSTSWLVPSGATRVTEFGEQMVLLVLNPFLDDAVLDLSFDSDVGLQSESGVVVPARRVLAIDLTAEVTVASRVSVVVDVVAGRVAVSRLQTVDGTDRRGLAVTPAATGGSAVWYLPSVHRNGRDDVITVVNPSETETAEVDLEIVADGDLDFDPIELTIRPGRSVAVPLADESRLGEATDFSVTARSLTGLPVAVMTESTLPFGDGPVSNLSATVGADAASLEWIAPVEADTGSIVILNPSDTTIATASVSVVEPGGERRVVADVEISPGRRTRVATEDLGSERPIVVVDATSPVVVGREFADVSVHALAVGIAADVPVTSID